MQTKFAEMVTAVAKHLNTDHSYLQVQNLIVKKLHIREI